MCGPYLRRRGISRSLAICSARTALQGHLHATKQILRAGDRVDNGGAGGGGRRFATKEPLNPTQGVLQTLDPDRARPASCWCRGAALPPQVAHYKLEGQILGIVVYVQVFGGPPRT